jgi:ATP-dependent Clp protease protease subunit
MIKLYRMEAKAGGVGEVVLYGTIGASWWGDGITAAQFKKDLNALGNVSKINLRISSDGGVITEAQAMYALLNEHPATIDVHIDGIAASAASFIAMVGKKIYIADGGFVMIHNAQGGGQGDAAYFEKFAARLRVANEMIQKKYADRTGQSIAKIADWMDKSTWFTAVEAVKFGFATDLVPNVGAVAFNNSALLSSYAGTPELLRPNRNKFLALKGKK